MNHTQQDPFQTDAHLNMLYREPTAEEYHDTHYASVNAAFTNYYLFSTSNTISTYGKGINKYTNRDNRGRGSPNPGRCFGGGRNTQRGGRGDRPSRGFENRPREYNKQQYSNPNKNYVQCDACKMDNLIDGTVMRPSSQDAQEVTRLLD